MRQLPKAAVLLQRLFAEKDGQGQVRQTHVSRGGIYVRTFQVE